jgi:hypothetical protein
MAALYNNKFVELLGLPKHNSIMLCYNLVLCRNHSIALSYLHSSAEGFLVGVGVIFAGCSKLLLMVQRFCPILVPLCSKIGIGT